MVLLSSHDIRCSAESTISIPALMRWISIALKEEGKCVALRIREAEETYECSYRIWRFVIATLQLFANSEISFTNELSSTSSELVSATHEEFADIELWDFWTGWEWPTGDNEWTHSDSSVSENKISIPSRTSLIGVLWRSDQGIYNFKNGQIVYTKIDGSNRNILHAERKPQRHQHIILHLLFIKNTLNQTTIFERYNSPFHSERETSFSEISSI